MGPIDHFDMIITTHETARKTVKLYEKLFFIFSMLLYCRIDIQYDIDH